MTKPPPQDPTDLSQLSDEQLLAGLATADLSPRNPIDIWIESAGVYPGTTKVPSAKLYAEYREFMLSRPDLGQPRAIRVWGKYMVTKFKHGKGEKSQFYYVSRERDVVIPTSIKTGV